MQIKNIFTTLAAFTMLAIIDVNAQYLQWAKSTGGHASERTYGIVANPSGYSYAIGNFSDTVDFDMGLGQYKLHTDPFIFSDIFIMKSDPYGDFVWAKKIGGSMSDQGKGITLDPSGAVITTGIFYSTADFDPGTGSELLSSAGGGDIFISKLDALGNHLWARRIGGSGDDEGYAVSCDASGNIFVTGIFNGLVDFDPGPGTYFLTGAAYRTIFVLKLDPAGNFLWAHGYGTIATNLGNAIDCDLQGNVYVTGSFASTIDFDAGGAVHNLTTSGSIDIFFLKLNSNGDFVWANQIGSTGIDMGNGIEISPDGELIATGYFSAAADFDPGPGTTILSTTAGGTDPYILKMDLNGNLIWAKSIEGGNQNERGMAISAGNNGKVYSIGNFSGTLDFDPGPGMHLVNSTATSQDIYMLTLDGSGNFISVVVLGGNDIQTGYGIDCDAFGNVYIGGEFRDTVDFDPSAGTNIYSAQASDMFLMKLGDHISPPNPGGISGPALNCPGDTAVFTVPPVAGAVSYTWGVSGDAVIVSGQHTATITIITGSSPGMIGVYAVNSYGGISQTSLLPLQLYPANQVIGTVTPSAIVCPGTFVTFNGTGALSYQWSGGVINNIPFQVNSPASYILTGTDVNGCISTDTVSISTVGIPPVVGFTALPSTSICSGSHLTLTGTGAASYSWSGGISNGTSFQPQVNTTYTVTGTNGNGCTATATVTIVVKPLPDIGYLANPSTTVCAGTMVILQGTGGLSYNWGSIANNTPFLPSGTATYVVNGLGANGCYARDTVFLVVNPLPIISVTAVPSGMVCEVDPITLFGNGAETYTYTNNAINGVPNVYPIGTAFLVTGTDTNGCTGTLDYWPNLSSTPQFIIQPPDRTVAAGSAVNFPVSVDEQFVQFQWQYDSGSGFTNVVEGSPFFQTNSSLMSINPISASMHQYRFRCVSKNSFCSDTSDAATLYVIGVWLEDPAEDIVSIYPNPATETVTVRFGAEQQELVYRLIDGMGRIITSGIFTGTYLIIEIQELAGGFYTLDLPGSATKRYKIIKK